MFRMAAKTIFVIGLVLGGIAGFILGTIVG
jgi:hypothetical protein